MLQYQNMLRNNINDEYSKTFSEAASYVYNTEHLNVLGEGAKDVYLDKVAFDSYAEKLTECFTGIDHENAKALLHNNRSVVLRESSMMGIPPITSLNAPIIVRLWAKLSLKKAIPTQVVDKPAFSVAFNLPYLIEGGDANKTKHYLPDALRADGGNSTLGDNKALPLSGKAILKANMKDFNLMADEATDKSSGVAQFQAGNEVDKELLIHSVTIDLTSGSSVDGQIHSDEKKEHEIIVDSPLTLDRKFYVEIKKDLKNTGGSGVVHYKNIIMGTADLRTGECTLMALTEGDIKSVKILGCFSSAPHNESTEIGFDVKKTDFEIGTGRHFEVNLPMEFVNDMYAIYQIDSASTATETMANVINQKLEQEIFNFIRNVQLRNPKYVGYFDAYPSANYAINPSEWASNIRRVIDHQCSLLKSDSYFYQCTFSVVGNPVDTQLIPNIEWSFNGNVESNGGVSVNYSLGATCGTNRYNIISSDLVPRGALYIVCCPTVEDFMTIKYYPYTFNVVHNYLNANGKKTMPNIMMTKRHTFGEFMPLLARIDIANNDGRIGYTQNGGSPNGGDTKYPFPNVLSGRQ